MRPRGARLLDALLGVMLRGVDALVRRRGVRSTYRLLRISSPGWGRNGEARGRSIAARVRRSAQRYESSDSDVSCLRQALATFWLLRWAAGRPTLVIGFRSEGGEGHGHAWVEIDGVVVGDDPAMGAEFPLRLDGDLTPAA